MDASILRDGLGVWRKIGDCNETNFYMKKRRHSPKHILKPLSLWPLKPEEALEAFMKVDPVKVEAKMRMLKRGGVLALSKG